MVIPIAQVSRGIDGRALSAEPFSSHTSTLIKTDSLKVIRWMLPAGKDIGSHELVGAITLQCIEGNVVFCTGDSENELWVGDLIDLSGAEAPWLRAIDDSLLLLTTLLKRKVS